MKATDVANVHQKPGPHRQNAETSVSAKDRKRKEVRALGYEEGQKALSPAGSDDTQTAKVPPKPAELGAALVLSTAGNERTVSILANMIAAKAAAWGLMFDRKAVRLASTQDGRTIVTLDWPAGLGPAPNTRVMPNEDMTPVDARLAMAAVPSLAGWGKLSGTNQAKLTALLEGETNAVSAATRDYLRPKYLDLKKKSADEQATALSATIGHKDATPSLVMENVETEPVALSLSGPKEVKRYEFRGLTADAHIFTATYGDGSRLEVVAPKAPSPEYHQYTATQAAEAARYLPKRMRDILKRIVLNPVTNPDDAYWAAQYNIPDFHSYMTAGSDGVVTIYPTASAKGTQPDERYMRGTMIHESGHTWSYRNWGTDKSKGKWLDWKKAMDSDGVSVSNYARSDIAEDVAETVQVYGSTKGKPKYDEYKKIIPARLAILEKEIG